MQIRKILAGLTAVAVLATACGDDDDPAGPGGGGDELTVEETESLGVALAAIGGGLYAGFGLGNGAVAADGIAAQSGSFPYDVTTNCPNGGTTRVHGTLNIQNASQTSVNYTGTLNQTYNNCRATGSGSRVFTFTGSPSLTYSVAYNPPSYQITVTQGGSFGWGFGDKSGTCSSNIQLSVSTNGTTVGSATYSGTVCGRSVNVTL